ncbi:DUF1127 domain-containing protein [Roseibacterium sp. SDUM158017]|uniref:DUF1127 domain-containing protein n=1 Tax=Roseicyclus salinarum TaxID=3036773 RepID=UPI002414EEAC|nr:DUF1127 domain-containing protein [Roseibacterium sp. SDUM158017]MDG4650371.1 DUF1127 domain-containing protein [Roseibacterium sp. SDUM158017]
MTDNVLKRVFPTLDFTNLPRKGTRHLHALLRRAREARDFRHLAGLPDYLLEDVGMTREQAKALARRATWDPLALRRPAD